MDYVYLIVEIIDVFVAIIAFYYGHEIDKKRQKTGVKEKESEWLRLILIVIGLILISTSIISYNKDYVWYSLLAIPIWIVFVWLVLPKISRKKSNPLR